MDTSVLEELGLTRAEIKVFVALVEIGSSSAGKIIKKSGLQNAVVHRAFHSLTEKGLVTYSIAGRIKNYRAIDPDNLVSFLEDKKRRIEVLIPELRARKKEIQNEPKAITFEGSRGIKELLNIIISKGKEYVSYGGAQKSDEILGTYFWESFHKKRIKKRVRARLLFHPSLKWWGEKLRKLSLTQVKTTEKNFEELAETVICGARVGIIIWLDKPYGLLIEEENASKSYLRYFEILWKQAKR